MASLSGESQIVHAYPINNGGASARAGGQALFGRAWYNSKPPNGDTDNEPRVWVASDPDAPSGDQAIKQAQSSKALVEILVNFCFEHGAKRHEKHPQTHRHADFMFGQRQLAINARALEAQDAILAPDTSQIELVFEVDRNMLGGDTRFFQAQGVIADNDDVAHVPQFNHQFSNLESRLA
jgi:hypothetical protein